jgi:hypothetical protein
VNIDDLEGAEFEVGSFVMHKVLLAGFMGADTLV